MKANEVPKKTSLFKQNRKIIFIILYLVILPIVTITLIYSITYMSNRPRIFKTTENTKDTYILSSNFKNYTKSKYIELNPKLDYKASEFNTEDKTLKTQGEFRFYFNIQFKNKNIKYIDSSAKIRVEADTYWKSLKLTSGERSLYKSSNWEQAKTFSETTIYMTLTNYMPVKPLFPVKLTEKSYHFYIKFSFKVELPRQGETEEIIEYLKISSYQWNNLLALK